MKIFKKLLTVAVAAMVITGCSKDEGTGNPETKAFTFNLIADGQIAGDTRTEYDPAIKNIKWSDGDKAEVFIDTYYSIATAAISANGDGSNTAAFTGSFKYELTPGTYKVQGFYPDVAFANTTNNTDGTAVLSYGLKLPVAQTASLTTFDKNADILIAKNMDVELTADDIAAKTKTIDNFRFGRPVAISKYTFTTTNEALSADEVVEFVTFKAIGADSPIQLAGNFYFAPETGNFISNKSDENSTIENLNDVFYTNKSTSVTVTFDNAVTLGDLVLWAVTAPVTLQSGDKIEFTIKTDRNTIVKTTTLNRTVEYTNKKLNTGSVVLGTTDIEITPAPVGSVASLTGDEIKNMTGGTGYDAIKTITNDYGIWTSNGYKTKATDNFLQLRSSSGGLYYIHIPKLPGFINAVELEVSNANNTTPGGNATTLYLRTENSTDPSTNIASGEGASSITLQVPEGTKQREAYVMAGGGVRIYSVKVTYTPSTDPYITTTDITGVPAIGVTDADQTAAYVVEDSAADAEVSGVDGLIVTEAVAADGDIVYSVAPNYSTTSRTGIISLALTGNPAITETISVTQEGSVFEVSAFDVKIPYDQTTTKFTVLSKDFGWEITPPAGVTVNPSSGPASSTAVEITVSSDTPNPGSEDIELGTITILRTGDDMKNAEEVTVTKAAQGSGPTVETASAMSGLVSATSSKVLETGKPITYVSSAANTYTNPMRVYSGSIVTIQGAPITEVVFTCNSNSYANVCKAATVTVDNGASVTSTQEGAVVTFTITGETTKFAIKPSAQTRFDGISVSYLSE